MATKRGTTVSVANIAIISETCVLDQHDKSVYSRLGEGHSVLAVTL